MEDEKIIELYNARNEFAIAETERKFGKMLFSVVAAIVFIVVPIYWTAWKHK